jgi:hypothetical protein
MQLPEYFGHGGFAPEPQAGQLADARNGPPDGIWPGPLHGGRPPSNPTHR